MVDLPELFRRFKSAEHKSVVGPDVAELLVAIEKRVKQSRR